MCPEVADEANPGEEAFPTGTADALGCGHPACGRRGHPSQLSLAQGGGDARGVCLFQDHRVGDFVLPVDVEKIAEALEL